jgi:tRNA threonylcarbamoyladenosine biosynthesis protein TsaB
MLFLAIETSSAQGSLALFEGAECLQEVLFREGHVHGREITARIRDLLDGSGLRSRDLEGLAVSVGPGSYTGIRVGVTAAKTLGFALRIPVAAVSSLEVLAATAAGEARGGGAGEPGELPPLAPILDGRRGFCYGALFRAGPGALLERLLEDQVAQARELAGRLEPGSLLFGDGADLLLQSLAGAARFDLGRAPRGWDLPRARALGKLAAGPLAAARFEAEPVHRLEPAYLRPSEPEIVLQRRQAGGGGP